MKYDEIKENLERYYQSVINASDERGFFLMICDYVYYFDKTLVLNNIATEVVNMGNEKAKKNAEYGLKTAKELQKTAKLILKLAKERKVSTEILERITVSGTLFNNSKPVLSGSPPSLW